MSKAIGWKVTYYGPFGPDGQYVNRTEWYVSRLSMRLHIWLQTHGRKRAQVKSIRYVEL